MPAGSSATIRRISEVTEHDAPQVLRQLEAIGLVPGAVVTVTVDVGGAGVGAVALSLGRASVALGYDVASLVHAEPV